MSSEIIFKVNFGKTPKNQIIKDFAEKVERFDLKQLNISEITQNGPECFY